MKRYWRKAPHQSTYWYSTSEHDYGVVTWHPLMRAWVASVPGSITVPTVHAPTLKAGKRHVEATVRRIERAGRCRTARR